MAKKLKVARRVTKKEFINLKGHLDYNSETGLFTWLKDMGGNRGKLGDVAGTTVKSGHIRIGLFKKFYSAHRLAWVFFYGIENQVDCIDHKDCNASNNSIENIREATRQKNLTNQKCRNSTKVKNVYWDKDCNKYRVQFRVNNKLTSYGRFTKLEEASQLAFKLRSEIHGEFANHK